MQPTLMFADNEGAKAIANKAQYHSKSKHFNIKMHWIHKRVEDKSVHIKSCRDPEQTVDILTKALARPKHKLHVARMGLSPI